MPAATGSHPNADAYITSVQRQIDAAGGIPADIPLTARLDCLIKQRDGTVKKPISPHFGKLTAEELGH